MYDIINSVIIVMYYIIDLLFLIPLLAECVISIGFLVAYYIIMLNVINWVYYMDKLSKILYILLYTMIILLFFIFILLMNIGTAVDDLGTINSNDILYMNNKSDMEVISEYFSYEKYASNYFNNVTYLSGLDDWHFNNDDDLVYNSSQNILNANNSLDNNYRVRQSLLNADIDSINNVFKDNSLLSSNRVMNKEELYSIFQNIVQDGMTSRHGRLDPIYTLNDVKDPIKFDALYKGIISIKASNNHLDLNWKELCRMYTVAHHRWIQFDINEINSYTPETFYSHMKTLQNNQSLAPWIEWQLRKYLNDSNKQNELYAYMRIVQFAINRN